MRGVQNPDCPPGLVVVDSVTQLKDRSLGELAVTGSHGGRFSARVALARGVRGAVFNDAGGGKDHAGVAGLAAMAAQRVPAVAVSHESARIGNGRDSLDRGTISAANEPARGLGVAIGMTCAEAVKLLGAAPKPRVGLSDLAGFGSDRPLITECPDDVWVLDSASLLCSEHDGSLVMTGSHGGLLGTQALSITGVRPLLVVFNDAGGGIDGAGWSRLPALELVGIAAATVASASARIGDGRSTLDEGVLSHVNRYAQELGAAVGLPVRAWVDRWTRAASGQTEVTR